MRVLISPNSAKEAIEAVKGGADIIDVKRPEEGSLGANFPLVIREVRKVTSKLELSATVGDCPNLPGTVSQAAVGAALAGADYVKVGLHGVRTKKEAEFLLKNVVENVRAFFPKAKVVASGYADYALIGSVPMLDLPEAAANAGCDGVLIDTAKKGKSLLEKATMSDLQEFVDLCHKRKIFAALAGKITKEGALKLKTTGVDIIGVRSAVCEGGDRVKGHITRRKVREFMDYVRK